MSVMQKTTKDMQNVNSSLILILQENLNNAVDKPSTEGKGLIFIHVLHLKSLFCFFSLSCRNV